MMLRTLVRLVVDSSYFLTSDESVVNPDDAIRMLEHIASTLKRELDKTELQQFLAIVDDLTRDPRFQGDERYLSFLRSFARDNGLVVER
jgi:hypothetical protein